MCIILDKNSFSGVLDPNSTDRQLKIVHNWVIYGSGKLVYGGTQYWSELSQATKYFRLFNDLSRSGKTIHIPDHKVDAEQTKIKRIIPDPKFNDSHLVAIVIVSGCRLICTKDTKCHKFIKNKQIYPKGFGVPIFYSDDGQLSSTSIKKLCSLCKKNR
jgi:hypothetical protein